MAIEFNIAWNSGGPITRTQDILRRSRDLARPIERLCIHHQKKAQRILRSGERGVQARNPAGLAASITWRRDGNEATIGSDKPYAAALQFGGDIRSSRPGGYLAIPIADNLAARGNPRFSSPKDVPEGFFFQPDGPGGTLFFGRELQGRRPKRPRIKNPNAIQRATFAEAAHAAIELLFMLVRSVHLRPFKYVTHDPDDQRLWERYVGEWLTRGK